MWYKNYPKGAPFYTVTTDFTLQKNYFAGWCLITHNDKSTSDRLLTTSGGSIRYGSNVYDRGIKPFPESELQVTLDLLSKYKTNSLAVKIKAAEIALSKLQEESSAMDSWNPNVIDFANRGGFDWSNVELDNGVYTEVHLA